MKILFCGISSKYIHTMPSGWFLSEYLKHKGVFCTEVYHNVNEPYENILNDVLSFQTEILLLSVYIFNVKIIKKLIIDIRKSSPQCKIIIGGPEVDKEMDADHIIFGEGEKALYNLLLEGGEKYIYEDIITNLDDIPSPYTKERLEKTKNKLVYYESSRGCPFHCSYCMASLSTGVRYFSLERVKRDLITIVQSGTKTIKFTDRTFNANTQRTNEILEFILETFREEKVCFHFEVGGDLFKQSTLDILQKMPSGLVQMEAGVQTLNHNTLKLINRVFDKNIFVDNISKIISFGNIHMHLDLISGLPEETLESFIDSFNQTMDLCPHMLQLGFLKFLKGTPIRDSYDAVYSPDAPYEIMSSQSMSENNLSELKGIDFVVDKLYNSGKFSNSLKHIAKRYLSSYEMYKAISSYFSEKGVKKGDYETKLYENLLDFMENKEEFKEILRFDYCISHNSRKIPYFLRSEHSKEFKKFLNATKQTKNYLYVEFSLLPFLEIKEKSIVVEFCYTYRNPVSGHYSYNIVTTF